jgi:hypothetical protein
MRGDLRLSTAARGSKDAAARLFKSKGQFTGREGGGLAIEAEALFNLPNRSRPDCVKVNRARHGRRQTVERIPAEPDGLLAPLRRELRSRRAGRFEGMDEAQPDEALDGVEFGPPHVFDFLSHMVQVEFVGQIPPSGEVA